MTHELPAAANFVPLRAALKDVLRGVEARCNSNNVPPALPTGFASLDAHILGLWPGELIVVASLPGVGATSLALNLVAHAAFDVKKTALVFSSDLGADETALRLIAIHGGIELAHLRTGQMEDEDWSRFRDAMSSMRHAGVLIDDTRQLTLGDLCHRARALAHGMRPDLIVVDRLQDLREFAADTALDAQDGANARALRMLARELDIPVVALSRFDHNPDWFDVTAGTPLDQHLRSPVAHAADTLIFVNRNPKRTHSIADPGSAWLVLARHRRGPRATVKLGFDGRYGRFWDPAW